MTAGVRVLTIGKSFDLRGYELRHVETSSGILSAIAEFQPDVIVTSLSIPSVLNEESIELRKRWIHVDPNAAEAEVASAIEICYAHNLWSEHPFSAHQPLVSVYTPTYNTGDYLRDAYQSLREQSYRNWEWVVVDDYSSDATWQRLEGLARDDIRVRPFRSAKRLGKIGATKDIATRLARGSYLVELDHDDMLTDFALDEVVKAFQRHPDAGMVYSNCASFYENGTFQRFEGEFWASRYRWTEYRGKKWLECLNPNIYDRFGPAHSDQFGWFLTVGPNHVRAFRAATFRELGGYNPELPVADDWDLYARFFLRSKCLHIDKMLYLYRYRDNQENATFLRNQSIQDHLALGRQHYEAAFRKLNTSRLEEAQEAADLSPVEPFRLQDVSVVVLEPAPTPLTLACLESVRVRAPGIEVILVVNGSEPAPEASALADTVVRVPHDVPRSAGCNLGARSAKRRVLCFLDNDARLVDESLEKLVAALSAQHPVVGPYSNRAKHPQGDYETAPGEDCFPPRIARGCVCMTKALFDELGGFDPRLSTFEDDDLCLRAAERGFGCKVVGGTFVIHEGHAPGRDVQVTDNQHEFARKHPVIRVIAIAKDEQRAIVGFYEQFRGITRDWCLLLDTGSNDETASAAAQIGVRVEHTAFADFAGARNEALARFAEDSAWILMLDPDERLDARTLRNLKELIYHTRHDVFLAPIQAGEARQSVAAKPFLFRNSADIRWIFKVQEKLIGSSAQALVKNARIDHLLELHDDDRRKRAEAVHGDLMNPRPAKIEAGPLVSVVIPTYRRRALLERAVSSALDQDYATLEVVIVGDGCPELDPAAFSGEPRVRVFNLPQNHGGGAIPRNHGICLAAGKLIAYLDDDNAWEPDHVSSLVRLLEQAGAAFAFSSMQVDGKDLGFAEPKYQGIDTSCILHDRDLIARYGGWRECEAGGYGHDWELVKRWLDGGERWVASKKPTLRYNAESSGQAGFLRELRG